MTVSLKRGSLLDAGFEKLGHCVRENQTRVIFDLAVHKSKARVFQLLSTDSVTPPNPKPSPEQGYEALPDISNNLQIILK